MTNSGGGRDEEREALRRLKARLLRPRRDAVAAIVRRLAQQEQKRTRGRAEEADEVTENG